MTTTSPSARPAPERSVRRRLSAGVAGLHPGYFAMVMATGILSTATQELRLTWLSLAMLYVAAASYVVLCVLTGWRLAVFTRRVIEDATAPDRAFALFTFVAGSDVLGLRLAAAGLIAAAAVLALAGAAAWLLLTYGIPTALIAARAKTSFAASVNGTWLIWVVGTQSVASTAATFAGLHRPAIAALTFVAIVLWLFGVVLYLLLMAIIVQRLLLWELSPEQLTPPYWITMGATAITVFAAAHILDLPGRLPLPATTITAAALGLWAFGSWWIPLLILLGVWRHLVQRVPLTYDPTLWSMVFPLGMYAAASEAFGRAAGIGELRAVAQVEIWFALVAWAAVLLAMIAGQVKTLRSR